MLAKILGWSAGVLEKIRKNQKKKSKKIKKNIHEI
jgi:hypothetical protein